MNELEKEEFGFRPFSFLPLFQFTETMVHYLSIYRNYGTLPSKIIGGLCGYVFIATLGSWVNIDYVWIDESKRGQGIGTQLFKRAEILARTKNCDYIKLFTWAFQAVDFYRKLGFECVGTIPKWIENYDAVFFKKKIKVKKIGLRLLDRPDSILKRYQLNLQHERIS